MNLNRGGGERGAAIISYLREQLSDVVILTEYRSNVVGHAIRHALAQDGLVHQATSLDIAGCNGVAILANEPIALIEPAKLDDQNRHRVLTVELGPFVLAAVYFPQKKAKAQTFYALQLWVEAIGRTPCLVFGDFNTGQNRIDSQASNFYCANEFIRLLDSGLVDCWRKRNPVGREFSWYSRSGNGFRIDHALASASLDPSIISIRYDHQPRESGISDHSALILDFDLGVLEAEDIYF